MELEKMTPQQLLMAVFGGYGTAPVPDTTEVRVRCHAFEAETDSVISSLKDENGQERIDDIRWASKTIPANKTVYFGFEAHSISLASGSGMVYRTEKPF